MAVVSKKKKAKKASPESENGDAPDWRKKAKQRQNEKSAGDRINLVEGENCLRVLPDKKDIVNGVPKKKLTHSPYREYCMHYGLGTNEKGAAACGYSIEGEGECWLCDVKIPELANNSKKAEKAERIGRKEAFLVQATMYEDGKFGPPKPWSVSTGSGLPGRQKDSLAVRVMSKLTGSKKDYLDPKKGYNLNIERSGTGLHTRYPSLEGDESPTEVPDTVLKKMVDLDTLIPVYDEDDIKAAYYGKERGRKAEDEDEDEETNDNEEESNETDDDAEESDDDTEAEESDDDDSDSGDDDDDSEESDEDEDSSDDDDADDDAEESEDSEDGDSDDDDEESDESDNGDDDDDSGNDDEEDEPEPVKPKKKAAAKKAPAKKAPAKKAAKSKRK